MLPDLLFNFLIHITWFRNTACPLVALLIIFRLLFAAFTMSTLIFVSVHVTLSSSQEPQFILYILSMDFSDHSRTTVKNARLDGVTELELTNYPQWLNAMSFKTLYIRR